MASLKQNYPIYLLVLFLFFVYLFFPTNNSTVDSYYYAASVKYGQNLLHPHHLLYSVLGWLFTGLFRFFTSKIQVLSVLKIMNAIAAGLLLLVFARILQLMNRNKREIFFIVLICGSCFGFCRFATENENYIVPILISLLASLFYLKFIQEHESKYVLISGFFAAFACLFHVIHFMWWLGLLIGLVMYKRKLKVISLYLGPALLVPVTYLFLLKFALNKPFTISSLISYLFEVFSNGQADSHIGFDNFYMTFISFVRTFFQVHGYILFLLKKNMLLIVPCLITLILFVIASTKIITKKEKPEPDSRNFAFTMGLVFLLQLLFAWFSKGNAEFMVMLPFLLLITFLVFYSLSLRALICMGLGLFLWNFSYGIFPLHHYKLSGSKEKSNFILNHKDALFIMNDANELKNRLYYLTGEDGQKMILKIPVEGEPTDSLTIKINAYLKDKKDVYTDGIDQPVGFNRNALVNRFNIGPLEKYKWEKVDSTVCLYGKLYLYKLLR